MLAPPADPEEIAQAERALDLSFPQQLVESLRCHDGLIDEAPLLPADPLFSVAGIVEHWEEMMGLAEEHGHLQGVLDEPPADPAKEPWWHRLWLPFAGENSESWIFDLRPGASSRTARHWHDAGFDSRTRWFDLEDLLAETADILEGVGDPKWRRTDLRPYLLSADEDDVVGGEELVWAEEDADEYSFGDPIRPAPIGR